MTASVRPAFSFRQKILAVLLVVGVVPLGVMGFLSYTVNRKELAATAERLQLQTARALARDAEQEVRRAVEGLQLSARALPLSTFSPDELKEVLRIPYRQVGGLNAVVLLDEKGDAVVAPVYEVEEGGGAPPGREAVTALSLEAFAAHVPMAQARTQPSALGAPNSAPDSQAPRVAIAVKVSDEPLRIMAAELSLQGLAKRVAQIAGKTDRAVLVDAQGHPVIPQHPLSAEEGALVSEGLRLGRERVQPVRGVDGEAFLAAFVPVPGLSGGALASQPASEAFRPANRVRDYTLYWATVAVGLTLALGLLLARSLSRPIAQLSAAAKALTTGSYGQRVPVETRDELGSFAQAFNHMAQEIERRDEDIRRWNEELKARVEQRTAELRAAQDQILRTRRLAALGSFGAGIAHELNNPMTAILGLTSIVQRDIGSDTPSGQTLGMVIEQAKRMAKIVAHIRQFSDDEREGGGRRFALSTPVRAAIDLFEEQALERKITVVTDLPTGVPQVQGDPVEIQQVVAHLVENAINAMPDGGTLRVALSVVEGEALKLSVEDTGKGIEAHLQERIFDPFFSTKHGTSTAAGLGLSVSHRIIEKHHGKILVTSSPGAGSTFTVLLPTVGDAAHLY